MASLSSTVCNNLPTVCLRPRPQASYSILRYSSIDIIHYSYVRYTPIRCPTTPWTHTSCNPRCSNLLAICERTAIGYYCVFRALEPIFIVTRAISWRAGLFKTRHHSLTPVASLGLRPFFWCHHPDALHISSHHQLLAPPQFLTFRRQCWRGSEYLIDPLPCICTSSKPASPDLTFHRTRTVRFSNLLSDAIQSSQSIPLQPAPGCLRIALGFGPPPPLLLTATR